MDDKILRLAGAVFALGTTVHIADHLRRGQGSVSDQINAAGTVGLVLQVVVITLIAVRHPRAPRAALLERCIVGVSVSGRFRGRALGSRPWCAR